YRHDPSASPGQASGQTPDGPASLSSDEVRAIYEDSGGVLWVGTGDGWLERFDARTETFIHHQYLGGNPVSKIVEDRAGNLWVGTETAGLYRMDRGRETIVQYRHDPSAPGGTPASGQAPDDDDGLSDNDVQALMADPAGGLWVGTFAGGLDLWDGADGTFAHYRHDPADPRSLARDAVLAFYPDPTDTDVVWIGTWGGGLDRFDRDARTFTHYTQADGLSDDTVGCILADSAGYLWLGTGGGLSRFDPRTETFRNYDERDGVQVGASAPGACFRGQDGEMYFGGPNGFDAFHPDQIEDNAYVPPVAITAFKVFNQVERANLPAGTQVYLSYADNFISFEFAALDYVIPEKNRYAYKMEGFDEDWVLAGTRRYADYPNLGPGDYVFRVRGSNNDGVWNEQGISIAVTVSPPFWETWWFRGIAILALVGVVLGGYRVRVRGIEARSRELERQVEGRTDELVQANVLLEQEMVERERAEAALAQQAAETAVVAERNRL
ncbi:MAG: histidine kinase, partial [bacterium]|nr:histidine kinase [bacterium]